MSGTDRKKIVSEEKKMNADRNKVSLDALASEKANQEKAFNFLAEYIAEQLNERMSQDKLKQEKLIEVKYRKDIKIQAIPENETISVSVFLKNIIINLKDTIDGKDFIAMKIYLDRFLKYNPEVYLNENNVQRLILACLSLGYKSLHDDTDKSITESLALALGHTVNELHKWEESLKLVMDNHLEYSVEEYNIYLHDFDEKWNQKAGKTHGESVSNNDQRTVNNVPLGNVSSRMFKSDKQGEDHSVEKETENTILKIQLINLVQDQINKLQDKEGAMSIGVTDKVAKINASLKQACAAFKNCTEVSVNDFLTKDYGAGSIKNTLEKARKWGKSDMYKNLMQQVNECLAKKNRHNTI